jgi:formylmethanofuran dehydrogenase subunit A
MADGSILAQQVVVLPSGPVATRPASPQAGWMRFNTEYVQFEGYTGTLWDNLGEGAKGGGADAVFYENDQTITTSYAITTGKNAMTAGPVTIANGVTVTIPDGSTWTIV